jgi:hypothetical protein
MTETTDTTRLNEAEQAEFDEQMLRSLVAGMIAGFDCIIQTIVNRPDVAPLLLPAFLNTNVALGSVRDPEGSVEGTGAADAKRLLSEAFAANGASVGDDDRPGFVGKAASLPGGVMALWFFTQDAMVDEAAAVVANVPASSPDDTVLLAVPAEARVPLPDLDRTQAMEVLPADDEAMAVAQAVPVAEQVSA